MTPATVSDNSLDYKGMGIWHLSSRAILSVHIRARLAEYEAGFVPPREGHAFTGSKRTPSSMQPGTVVFHPHDTGYASHILLAHSNILAAAAVTNMHSVLVLRTQEDRLRNYTRGNIPPIGSRRIYRQHLHLLWT